MRSLIRLLVPILLLTIQLFTARAANTANATSASSIIQGTVLDADAKPIKGASILVKRYYGDDKELFKTVPANPKGRFRFELPTGWYLLYAMAPNHELQQCLREIYCSGQQVEIKAMLSGVSADANPDKVSIITGALHFDVSKKLAMTKGVDGTWSIDMSTSSDTVTYQVLLSAPGSQPQTLCGTQFDDLSFTLSGMDVICRSVIHTRNGLAHIVFDPRLCQATKGNAFFEITDAATKKQMSLLLEDRQNTIAHLTAINNDVANKPSNWDVQKMRAEIYEQIRAEKDPTFKQMRMMMWLNLNPLKSEIDTPNVQVVDEILSTIPATSLLWEWHPECVMWAQRKSSHPDGNYGELVKTTHADEWVRQTVQTDQGSVTRKEQYTRSQTENARRAFAATQPSQAAAQSDEIGLVRRGAPLPQFAFETLDDSGAKITNASLRGKWVLVDNWATWCGPCVREMPALHAAYEAYKNKNFTILSVSFDRQKADIAKFRTGKNTMPWMHCFSPGVWENDAVKIFEAHSIPKPILIDPQGQIRAIGVELRGVNLEQTLQKFIK